MENSNPNQFFNGTNAADGHGGDDGGYEEQQPQSTTGYAQMNSHGFAPSLQQPGPFPQSATNLPRPKDKLQQVPLILIHLLSFLC
jgi:hypothetical protein